MDHELATIVTYYPGRLRIILFTYHTYSIFPKRLHSKSPG